MSCWPWCICGTISCLVFLFVGIGVPIILYQKPYDPTFTLERAVVTGFNLTRDGHLTSFFNVTMQAYNPNYKRKLRYKKIRVSVYKDKQKLGTDPLSGFIQCDGEVTNFMAEPVAVNVSLKKGHAFQLRNERVMGYLDFDVLVKASLNGGDLEVSCAHAVVNFTVTNSSNDDTLHNFKRIGCSVKVEKNGGSGISLPLNIPSGF